MERYLLFDSGCKFCTQVATQIENEVNGKIMSRSLRDPEILSILRTAKSEWKWEPMLLEVKANKTRVYSGLQMRIRLTSLLGVRQAWKVAQIIQDATLLQAQDMPARRAFLRTAGGLLSGVAFFGFTGTPAKSSGTEQLFLPMVTGGATSINTQDIPEYNFQQVHDSERQDEILQIVSQESAFTSVQNRTLNSSPGLAGDAPKAFEIYGSDNEWLGVALVQNVFSDSFKAGVICGISVENKVYASAALGELDSSKQNFISHLWKPDDNLYSDSVRSAFISEDMIVETTNITSMAEIFPDEVQAASPWWWSCENFCAFMCGWGWTWICGFGCPAFSIATVGVGAIMCALVCYAGGFISCMGCRPYCNHLCNQNPGLC